MAPGPGHGGALPPGLWTGLCPGCQAQPRGLRRGDWVPRLFLGPQPPPPGSPCTRRKTPRPLAGSQWKGLAPAGCPQVQRCSVWAPPCTLPLCRPGQDCRATCPSSPPGRPSGTARPFWEHSRDLAGARRQCAVSQHSSERWAGPQVRGALPQLEQHPRLSPEEVQFGAFRLEMGKEQLLLFFWIRAAGLS